MRRKTKLKWKYKVRRAFLVIILAALVAAGGCYVGRSGMLEGDEPESSGEQTSQSSSQEELEPEDMASSGAESQMDTGEQSSSELEADPEQGEGDELEPQPRVEEFRTSEGDWNLLLVSAASPLPAGFEPPSLTVVANYNGKDYEVDSRIGDNLQKMLVQAKLDGINLMLCSAYRTVEYQQGLFDTKIEEFQAAGYTQEGAVVETAAMIAVPGTSEHHTGLAVDIVTPEYQELDEGFAETPAFKWLDENAHKYGFIMRYPKEKQDITKIIYEPWHYRFVGEEHAAIIKQKGYTLEEYLEIEIRRPAEDVELMEVDGEGDGAPLERAAE